MVARSRRGLGRLDVLVTCSPYGPAVAFPKVRGYYLAKHLARSGLRAEFRLLPADDLECDILICSDYQGELEWFAERLEGPLGRVRARGTFCMAAFSLGGREHFSSGYCEWFTRRGGVLCHLVDAPLAVYEHHIGVGVDATIVPSPTEGPEEAVVFDFPAAQSRRTADSFDPRAVEAARAGAAGCRVVGTGPPDSGIRMLFDEWVDYGQPHEEYVAQAYRDAVAFVPGWKEAMGLAVAEAQVAGACIVAARGQVRDEMLCPDAAVFYDPDDPGSLADAVAVAAARDRHAIRGQALDLFDFHGVVERTRAAIGI